MSNAMLNHGTMTCPHCGSSIDSDVNFCPRCGTDLRPEGSASHPDSEQSVASGTTSPQPTQDLPSADKLPAKPPGATPKPAPQRRNQPDASEQIDLFPNLSGLLEPVGVSGEWDDELLVTADRRVGGAVDADALRRIRYHMLQEPTLGPLVQPLPPTHGIYRVRWIFGLLALALLIPFFVSASGPMSAKQPWEGVSAAYSQIESSGKKDALVMWAYDPATAGEMDQLFLPVLRHLLRQEVNLEVVSLLPGGLATAQRMLDTAVSIDERSVGQNAAQQAARRDALHFVPGGVAALPLIASTICGADCTDSTQLDLKYCAPTCDFSLVVVVAAQAEDVQRWLEIVAPKTNMPVVAVASAAADLPLQPYLRSGQLAGLVGGFDGAANYLEKSTLLLKESELAQRWRLLYDLRWGHFALLIVIFLGNLVALGTVRPEG